MAQTFLLNSDPTELKRRSSRLSGRNGIHRFLSSFPKWEPAALVVWNTVLSRWN